MFGLRFFLEALAEIGSSGFSSRVPPGAQVAGRTHRMWPAWPEPGRGLEKRCDVLMFRWSESARWLRKFSRTLFCLGCVPGAWSATQERAARSRQRKTSDVDLCGAPKFGSDAFRARLGPGPSTWIQDPGFRIQGTTSRKIDPGRSP